MKHVAGSGKDHESVYARMVGDPERNVTGTMMLRLIEHLEAENDASEQWVFTQADDLVFTNIQTPLRGKQVYVGVKQYAGLSQANGYEIMYFAEPPWWSVTGYASDVTTAAQMIREAIQRTVEREEQL